MISNGKVFVAGVDGCRDGWVAVLLEINEERRIQKEEVRVVPTFDDLLHLPESPRFVGIDIPLGLPNSAVPGGRTCDQEARRLLGHKRGTSVFSPPVRSVLRARSYEEALKLNRESSRHDVGITMQVYNVLPKLREVHEVMTPELQARVREVHPELSFAAMQGEPVEASKHSPQGKQQRLKLLDQHFADVEAALAEAESGSVTDEDVIDAYAAAWTAWRMAIGKAQTVPEHLQVDPRGLRMGIWF